MNEWLACPQPRLGGAGVVVMLVVTAFITPYSLDMYTPALPQMTDAFNTTAADLNGTLVWFYVLFAAGQLFFGPVSDLMGRRPLMVTGSVVYAAGSAACATASSVAALMVFRMVQAVGAGAVAAISMALVKDVFVPERHDIAFSVVTSLFGIAPVIAPLLGALLMGIAGWRSIFWALSAFGAVCLAFSLLLAEPPRLKPQMTHGVFGGLVRLLADRRFALYLLAAAMFSLPFMAYIATASYVYVIFFGLAEIQYGVYFGVAALAMVVGPFLWPLFSRIAGARAYMWALTAVGFVAGAVLAVVGGTAPWVFCGVVSIFILVEASVRPFSANILLAQGEGDAGAASALVNASHNVTSIIGLAVAALPWTGFVFGLGVITMASLVISAALYALSLRLA